MRIQKQVDDSDAILKRFAGEPLAGSGFEREEAEPGFSDEFTADREAEPSAR
jgi:hypothetical protein